MLMTNKCGCVHIQDLALQYVMVETVRLILPFSLSLSLKNAKTKKVFVKGGKK